VNTRWRIEHDKPLKNKPSNVLINVIGEVARNVSSKNVTGAFVQANKSDYRQVMTMLCPTRSKHFSAHRFARARLHGALKVIMREFLSVLMKGIVPGRDDVEVMSQESSGQTLLRLLSSLQEWPRFGLAN
jgi:hypothetical protein